LGRSCTPRLQVPNRILEPRRLHPNSASCLFALSKAVRSSRPGNQNQNMRRITHASMLKPGFPEGSGWDGGCACRGTCQRRAEAGTSFAAWIAPSHLRQHLQGVPWDSTRPRGLIQGRDPSSLECSGIRLAQAPPSEMSLGAGAHLGPTGKGVSGRSKAR
jgi:hypothetical protein